MTAELAPPPRRPRRKAASAARSASPTAPSGSEYNVYAPIWGDMYDIDRAPGASKASRSPASASRASSRRSFSACRKRRRPAWTIRALAGLHRVGRPRLRDRAIDLPGLAFRGSPIASRAAGCTAPSCSDSAQRSPAATSTLGSAGSPISRSSLSATARCSTAVTRRNVLDGPLSALKHLVELLAERP